MFLDGIKTRNRSEEKTGNDGKKQEMMGKKTGNGKTTTRKR